MSGALLLVGVSCLTVATACTSSEVKPNPTPSAALTTDVPSLLTGLFVPRGPAESLTGTLVRADGCVAFTDSATESTVPVLWPLGSHVGPGALSVVLDNGSVDMDAPLDMWGVRIQAKELWTETAGVAECAPDPEQLVLVVTGLRDILMQQ
ncbi:hypothetical protein B7R21_15280 [Subtercola boreus]|uniref:Uncharacterized protein n=1 Tax=Subtercola boreus TaxID=120213 RepID=A0A3E0VCT1_9MICO|nr:hypothetical protein [Subtercola boreus]RFA07551.1 hypothetical protein B7R21_15280 [Subtercola boreus]